MDLYFQRHDGQAVQCDDFLKAMEDANGVDLGAFRLWYSQVILASLLPAAVAYPGRLNQGGVRSFRVKLI